MFEFFCFFPFCLKPCGFSRPGDFFDTIKTEGTGGARQVWQVKKYGMPKSGICGRLLDFFMQPRRRRSLDIGTAHRNFVSKNPRTRIAIVLTGLKQIAPALTSQGDSVFDSKTCPIHQWQQEKAILLSSQVQEYF